MRRHAVGTMKTYDAYIVDGAQFFILDPGQLNSFYIRFILSLYDQPFFFRPAQVFDGALAFTSFGA